MAQATPEWLQQQLATLLASPYIHFSHPPTLPSGRRLGHGPVDLFSTRFNNLFADDAAGTVAAQPVDRAGLKTALLALQSRWASDSARFTPAPAADADTECATHVAWARTDGAGPAEVAARAAVRADGGAPRIARLALDGDAALFVKAA